ncbi:pilus assembly protein N-terminal domain-containing protein [Massilia sp. IC2-278]|uniref:type II and III secretion system protein family protein n=1 Tax=Massilia sp. IC2-278 TaxID=2887200 RepID=UPI001E5E7FB6|nr:pilus assembly protein N-terminal domain-containing protein [Massilia sp. IC2-278]MCC2961277.1 pilus assembly protein N-terminal domain-containing protein [Massilia sp. IC2-278]
MTLTILNHRRATGAPLRSAVAICLGLACSGTASVSTAQAVPAHTSPALAPAPITGATSPNPAAARRDTAGEILRAKPGARRDAAKTTPYAPVKKTEDDSQIPEIEMFVGESRVFPTPGVARIAVGNGAILSAAALDEKETILFANGAGSSTLFIWNEDGRYQRIKVNIVPGDIARVARDVAAFMASIPNARTSVVGDKVIVEGNALSDEDREKVAELAKRYPQIVNFTSAIGWEKMVMMDVKVVEFPKSELRDIGLKWNANGGAAIGSIWGPIRRGHDGPYMIDIPGGGNGLPISDAPPPGSGAGNSNGTATIPTSLNVLGALNLGLSAELKFLEQQGTASILAEPQLSARSGYKASFLAGGEFPYSVASQNGVTILFKQYGIKLEIEPRVGRDGIIRAVIESEVSSIDPSVSTPSGPALLTRRTKTEFNTRDGETMVLSGLLQRNISDDVDKVPFLGNLPVLGPLFRSKRYQNRETELVVFVTPTVVDSRSPGLVDRVQKTTERLSERLDRSPYLSDPLQPGSDSNRPDRVPTGTPQQSLPAPATAPAGAPRNTQ